MSNVPQNSSPEDNSNAKSSVEDSSTDKPVEEKIKHVFEKAGEHVADATTKLKDSMEPKVSDIKSKYSSMKQTLVDMSTTEKVIAGVLGTCAIVTIYKAATGNAGGVFSDASNGFAKGFVKGAVIGGAVGALSLVGTPEATRYDIASTAVKSAIGTGIIFGTVTGLFSGAFSNASYNLDTNIGDMSV